MVVLSPPGMISASMSSSCSGRRTSTASAPIPVRTRRCSAKSPWRPRTPTRAVAVLPAADGKALGGRDRLERETAHRLTETARDLGDELRVGRMRRRLDDRLRAARGLSGLEDPGSDEVPLGAELHHQRGVGRRRDAARAEEHDRELLLLRDALHELARHAVLLRLLLERGLVQILQRVDLRRDRAQMANGLDDVAGAGLALAADHRRALVDATQRLTEIARAADEPGLEDVLVDVELLVGRREDFAFVDAVDAQR